MAWGGVMGGSHAAETVDTGHVKARLVASVGAAQPGEQITVGLHQRIIPHWHTYWRNPGDSGLPTTIEWSLPAGAQAGGIQWPVPHRFKLGPVTNYGYENEVTLLTAVTVPADAKPGGTLPLQAKVNWLVCQETCIPQEVQLTLSLPIVAAGEKDAAPPAEAAALIDRARAQLPRDTPWPVTVEQQGKGLALRIAHPAVLSKTIQDVWFYPAEWGKVAHDADQPRAAQGDALVLRLQAGEAPAAPGQPLEGVLVVTESTNGQDTVRGYTLSPTVRPGAADGSAPADAPAGTEASAAPATAPPLEADLGLGAALLLALLGGIVLNLMPCVFPVLSIKALSLLAHNDQSPAQTRRHGLIYTLGVLSSFALLAGLLIALKAGGSQVGWGFQFQSPLFVLIVAYLMFAVGLSLSGVFTIGGSVAGVGSSLASRPGYLGSFFTGVLATIVATPCTAPFMGGAVGYALAQPPVVLLSVFLSLGLGLALPYLLLSTWPALQRWLPRPGLWMERVKQGFAFPMYGAAVWLVWVLAQQAGIDSVAVALTGMLAIAFAAWLYDSTRHGSTTARRSGLALASLALIAAVLGGHAGINLGVDAAGHGPSSARLQSNAPQAGKAWEPYTSQRLDELRAKGEPVFLNMTAAWCITCLVNERVALNKPSVAQAFEARGITYLKGDWTNQDPQITRLLADFGRSGVPLYVYYPKGPGAKPVVLPQILTAEVVVTTVTDAAVAVSSVSPSIP
ncbi:MAG: thiol:disulfide interchange protein [Rubrivivax sp.]|nr:MAG: thiol:disulfide interchange protein [Rubrivivax sp.]